MAIPIIGQTDPREKKIIVFSHERSGTHFLMNTIGENFGYNNLQWIDIDFIPLNMWHDEGVLSVFHQAKRAPNLNMLKCHHNFDFFENTITAISKDFYVFYIYREGKPVMNSFAIHLNRYKWKIGPKTLDGDTLAKEAPIGAVMRYQMRQYETMWHRWQDHVTGWLTRVPTEAKENIMYVKYDDLNENFNNTTREIAKFIHMPCLKPIRPDKEKNVIK